MGSREKNAPTTKNKNWRAAEASLGPDVCDQRNRSNIAQVGHNCGEGSLAEQKHKKKKKKKKKT